MGLGQIQVDMTNPFIKRVVFMFNLLNPFDPISL